MDPQSTSHQNDVEVHIHNEVNYLNSEQFYHQYLFLPLVDLDLVYLKFKKRRRF